MLTGRYLHELFHFATTILSTRMSISVTCVTNAGCIAAKTQLINLKRFDILPCKYLLPHLNCCDNIPICLGTQTFMIIYGIVTITATLPDHVIFPQICHIYKTGQVLFFAKFELSSSNNQPIVWLPVPVARFKIIIWATNVFLDENKLLLGGWIY